jgi:hypothetical protein
MKPHHQDAHIAETDKAKRLLMNLRLPIINNLPTVVKRYGSDADVEHLPRNPYAHLRVISHGVYEILTNFKD